MPKVKRILEIDCPKPGRGREMLRVFANELHGEAVISLHGDGKMYLTIYAQGVGKLPHKTHEINPDFFRVVEIVNPKETGKDQ